MTVVLTPRPPVLQAKKAKFRKRFLLVGIGCLAVLGPLLGVSFLGNSGTASASVTGSPASSLVYTGTIPCDMLGIASGDTSTTSVTVVLANGTTATVDPATSSCVGPSPAPVTQAYLEPSWSPAANSAGSVTSGGDISVIDLSAEPSGTNAIVNLYTTNLQNLGSDYSSFALPVDVYQCTPTTTSGTASCTTASAWSAVANASSYITNTNGSYSISLPGGYYYDITINKGGEYYCISTTAGSLAPTFFVTAQLA